MRESKYDPAFEKEVMSDDEDKVVDGQVSISIQAPVVEQRELTIFKVVPGVFISRPPLYRSQKVSFIIYMQHPILTARRSSRISTPLLMKGTSRLARSTTHASVASPRMFLCLARGVLLVALAAGWLTPTI